jgi:hypothetical protein
LRLLIRVASNLMGHRSHWAPGLGNIYGIISWDHVRLLNNLPECTTIAQKIVTSLIFLVTEILVIEDHNIDSPFLHVTLWVTKPVKIN